MSLNLSLDFNYCQNYFVSENNLNTNTKILNLIF